MNLKMSFECKQFINDTELGLLILNLVSSRSFYAIKNDESLETILIKLQNLNFKEIT